MTADCAAATPSTRGLAWHRPARCCRWRPGTRRWRWPDQEALLTLSDARIGYWPLACRRSGGSGYQPEPPPGGSLPVRIGRRADQRGRLAHVVQEVEFWVAL